MSHTATQNKTHIPQNATALLALEDGTLFWGRGFGAKTQNVAEICFNTSMTGYQEILTDPSYAGQIITFTFPHIGNTGTNVEDIETVTPAARGLITREYPTTPSNWRDDQSFTQWLTNHNIPGICDIDTRALTIRIRDLGAPKGVLIHADSADQIDADAAVKMAQEWSGLKGLDLAKDVSCTEVYSWDETLWTMGTGYGQQTSPKHHVVAIDYGAKRNILRCLASAGCKVTVVPSTATAQDILNLQPDGVFLSNGPGDPAATGAYAVPVINELIKTGLPIFGICLGHQLLALSLGGKTEKLGLGHRGANHPVKDIETGKVEITSQNHGFVVLENSLPEGVKVTHTSLFDGTNEGLRVEGQPVFSVQHHPEASPGPMDSHYLFDRFVALMDKASKKAA